jgi:bifunctional DNA-binding transcriptional regulator/antitoxin component of YhaV-PrlF toxin-antitoxin module
MRLLGTVELGTNKRITVPQKLVDALKMKEGDYIQFFEDKGVITVTAMKG